MNKLIIMVAQKFSKKKKKERKNRKIVISCQFRIKDFGLILFMKIILLKQSKNVNQWKVMK